MCVSCPLSPLGRLDGLFATEWSPTRVTLNVSEEILNEILTNITISTISELGLWTVPVDVSKHLWVNSYDFSRPLNLLLPYTVAVLYSLPLIGLGLVALYWNGVPAIDGGLFQLLMTTRGCEEIDRVAAKGCLGGESNVPPELKNMEARYGELKPRNVKDDASSSGAGPGRLIGFGPKGEVVPLPRRRLNSRARNESPG
ncbi:hypothetical protein CDD83_4519 [Cordyceps sp. RAO-2017]|nr:hypothetical protein CDD83_4519 [Cordyceps sp. RAO-2017]